MKALVSDGFGSVVLAEVAEPSAAPNEAVVELGAISVNRGETFQLEAPAPDWRPGKDFAGTVIRAAADGTGPAAGTRVVGHGFHSAWAERLAIDTGRIVPLPDSIAMEDAAALPLAGLTALRLGRLAGISAGSTVLLTGASGGVGHYVAELAGRAGAHVTAVVATAARGRMLREFGARTVTDIADAGTGYDIGMESIGGDQLAQVRRRVSPRGQVIWFGQAGRTPATLDFFDWVEGTAAAPITQFHYLESDRPLSRDLATLVDLVDRGFLHPLIDRHRPVADAAAAIEDLRARRILGNLVLNWS